MCVCVCVSRILSLACSPSGTSFVCSAAAPTGTGRSGSVTETVTRLPFPVSGQLLLWDTKTVKPQVRLPCISRDPVIFSEDCVHGTV